jgi:hypothetical protein
MIRPKNRLPDFRIMLQFFFMLSFDIESLDALSFDIVSFFMLSLDIESFDIESLDMLSLLIVSFFMPSSAAKAGASARPSDTVAADRIRAIRFVMTGKSP